MSDLTEVGSCMLAQTQRPANQRMQTHASTAACSLEAAAAGKLRCVLAVQ